MILGLIPARAGSKGIENKNIYPLCGKPLIEWTIDATERSILDDYVISTDIGQYISRKKGMYRPYELCQDDTPMISVVQDVVKHYPVYVDAICLLQPTSPLRTAEDISKCIYLYLKNNATCLYSGYYIGIKTDKPYDKHTSEKHFQRNGAIFITSRELIEQGKLWDDTVIKYEMPLSRSIDIDDMDDMYICESILKNPKEVRK